MVDTGSELRNDGDDRQAGGPRVGWRSEDRDATTKLATLMSHLPYSYVVGPCDYGSQLKDYLQNHIIEARRFAALSGRPVMINQYYSREVPKKDGIHPHTGTNTDNRSNTIFDTCFRAALNIFHTLVNLELARGPKLWSAKIDLT